mgnify:CR=1 FL=1
MMLSIHVFIKSLTHLKLQNKVDKVQNNTDACDCYNLQAIVFYKFIDSILHHKNDVLPNAPKKETFTYRWINKPTNLVSSTLLL